MLSFYPRDVLDEILDLIEAVSEGFPTYSYINTMGEKKSMLGLRPQQDKLDSYWGVVGWCDGAG